MRPLVSSRYLPRSGGTAASGRHAEEADDPDEEEEEELFFFFPPRFFLPPRFRFSFWLLELELSESEVTGAAVPLPRRDSSCAYLQVASLGQYPLLSHEKHGCF